jgi:hypothetical protein
MSRTAGRADLRDEAVLDQDVNRIGGGPAVEGDDPHLTQQQR